MCGLGLAPDSVGLVGGGFVRLLSWSGLKPRGWCLVGCDRGHGVVGVGDHGIEPGSRRSLPALQLGQLGLAPVRLQLVGCQVSSAVFGIERPVRPDGAVRIPDEPGPGARQKAIGALRATHAHRQGRRGPKIAVLLHALSSTGEVYEPLRDTHIRRRRQHHSRDCERQLTLEHVFLDDFADRDDWQNPTWTLRLTDGKPFGVTLKDGDRVECVVRYAVNHGTALQDQTG